MIDFFGLRKGIDAPAGGSPRPDETLPAVPSPGEKRLWAVLLVLDTVFLFVFAGAIAGMLWMHGGKVLAPAPRPQAVKKKESSKTPRPENQAAPEAPAPPPAAPKPSAAPRRAEETAASRAKPAPKLPTGSPSVLAPDLPRRETAPARSNGDSAAPAAPAARGERPRAQPVEFACRAKDAKSVHLKGPFLVRTGGVKSMVRGDDGVWRLTVSLLPGTYKYHCVVDGKKHKTETITVQ